MDFSSISHSEVRKFFQQRDSFLTYKSAVPFEELFTSHPGQTYKNFKTKTHLPWMPLDLQKLGRNFPSDIILKEAKAIEHLALAHKSDGDSSKGWKSLCLHGLGTQATLSCDQYGYKYDHETPYDWTEASELCPITTLYFKNVFPHSRFNRLRFMYLEPGGYIAPHEDVLDPNPHFTAINIAVNQPKDCTFLMGVPDFHSQSRWGVVPFQKGGDCFWLDLRNHHSVVNLSSETRIHIIVHFLLNLDDTKNLQRFVHMLPSSDFAEIPSPNKSNEKLKVVLGLWQPQIQSHQEGLQPYIDLTDRFSRSLEPRIDLKDVLRAPLIDEILAQAIQSSDADYLLCLGPGQIIHRDEVFWKELAQEISRPENKDVALWAHIIDKRNQSYPGLHPQLFFLNLKKYRSYGSGRFGLGDQDQLQLKAWLRSEENVHDDYTPTFLKPLNGSVLAKTSKEGWSLIHETLGAHFEIRNFSQVIRDTKIHGYPEENFEELAKFRSHNILENSPKEGPLFEGQVTFLNWLRKEIQSSYSHIRVYNNDSILNLPEPLKNRPLSFIIGPTAGHWDFSLFSQIKKASDFKRVHFDSSLPNLEFKKSIIHKLSHEPFQLFLLRYLRDIPETINVLENKPGTSELSYDELRKNPLWQDFRGADHFFLHQDLFKDTSRLMDFIPQDQAGVFCISNLFHFLPSLWLYNQEETRTAFLRLLQKIEEKSRNVYILGKDIYDKPIFFENVSDLLKRFIENKR